MITEKATIKNEAIYSDDKKHRFIWQRVWDTKKPMACVIMINPCQGESMILDTTSSIVVNNIIRLGDYGGVSIVNLFSLLTPKLNFKSLERLNDVHNDLYVKKAAEEASTIILAWGKSSNANAKIYNRAKQVLKLLEEHKEKFKIISDGEREAIHPLTPTARSCFNLVEADNWLKESERFANEREKKEQERIAELKSKLKDVETADDRSVD